MRSERYEFGNRKLVAKFANLSELRALARQYTTYKRCGGSAVPVQITPLCCRNMRFFLSPLCALLLAVFVVALPVRSSQFLSVWLLRDLFPHLYAPEKDIKRDENFIENSEWKRGAGTWKAIT